MPQKKLKHVNPQALAERVPQAVAERVTIGPVALVDQGMLLTEIEGLPEEYKKGETLSGFPPSPEWKNSGDAIFGHFVIMRPDIGPNNSRLYEIAAFQGKDKDPLTVAVWGSAALDRLFDSAFPPIVSGDRLAIIYLGEKATKRGLNPVKLFALKVVRESGKQSKLHAS